MAERKESGEKKSKVKRRGGQYNFIQQAKDSISDNTAWIKETDLFDAYQVDPQKLLKWLYSSADGRIALELQLYYPACRDGERRFYIASIIPHISNIIF